MVIGFYIGLYIANRELFYKFAEPFIQLWHWIVSLINNQANRKDDIKPQDNKQDPYNR
jgi:hypothetical protein